MPTPPDSFGRETIVGENRWGVLGNDLWGDCVLAGAAHEHMVWSRVGGNPADFSYSNVIQAYSDVTGFDPTAGSVQNNPTDQGTAMADALHYRRNHGMFDRNGNIHRIEAYTKLERGNVPQLLQAAYLFSAVGVGFLVPHYALRQWYNNEPWTWTGEPFVTVGGHYVPVVGYRDGMLVTITWGKVQWMSPEFYYQFSDESYAMFDFEMLHGDKTPEGFDRAHLLDDLEELTR